MDSIAEHLLHDPGCVTIKKPRFGIFRVQNKQEMKKLRV
jgi:hypothetical protein